MTNLNIYLHEDAFFSMSCQDTSQRTPAHPGTCIGNRIQSIDKSNRLTKLTGMINLINVDNLVNLANLVSDIAVTTCTAAGCQTARC